MKEKKKFGLESQDYEAPRAESVEVAKGCLMCASIDGVLQEFTEDEVEGDWGIGN